LTPLSLQHSTGTPALFSTSGLHHRTLRCFLNTALTYGTKANRGAHVAVDGRATRCWPAQRRQHFNKSKTIRMRHTRAVPTDSDNARWAPGVNRTSHWSASNCATERVQNLWMEVCCAAAQRWRGAYTESPWVSGLHQLLRRAHCWRARLLHEQILLRRTCGLAKSGLFTTELAPSINTQLVDEDPNFLATVANTLIRHFTTISLLRTHSGTHKLSWSLRQA
jgi:hypothetical protein